jgi:peptide/nickel transport system substrate-binding protein
LKEIGLRDSDGDGVLEYGAERRPLEITLLTDRTARARQKMAEITKSNLAEVGIRVNVQLLLPNELASRFLGSFDYEAILFGLTPTDIVPDLQAEMWHSSGQLHVWNPGQEKPDTPWEAEIDQLTNRLVKTLDSEARKEVFNQIQTIWFRELPTISTVAPNILVGWKNSVGNLRPSILTPFLLWNAEELTKSPR